MKFCGEIEYPKKDGNIHSDICHSHDDSKPFTEEDRKFYHDLLDEWFNNSSGEGIFWLGDANVWNVVAKNAVENYKTYGIEA